MIRRDYILRWTKELAKVLAQLLGKQPELQLTIIRETYDNLLDLDIDRLDNIPLEGLLPYLIREKQYDEAQLEFLAEILYRHGQLYLKCAQIPPARRRLQEALLIFESLDAQQDVYSLERQDRMKTIRQAIDKNME